MAERKTLLEHHVNHRDPRHIVTTDTWLLTNGHTETVENGKVVASTDPEDELNLEKKK